MMVRVEERNGWAQTSVWSATKVGERKVGELGPTPIEE